jgi:hypothetical protein
LFLKLLTWQLPVMISLQQACLAGGQLLEALPRLLILAHPWVANYPVRDN